MRGVMIKLCSLYGIERIIDKPHALYMGGYLDSNHLRILRTEIKENLLT